MDINVNMPKDTPGSQLRRLVALELAVKIHAANPGGMKLTAEEVIETAKKLSQFITERETNPRQDP